MSQQTNSGLSRAAPSWMASALPELLDDFQDTSSGVFHFGLTDVNPFHVY